jgi:zinc protease
MNTRSLQCLMLILFAWNLSPLAASSAQPESRAGNTLETVLQPNRSPIISFRIVVRTGAADDLRGQEGVAALTAAMLAQGGSRALSYEQILDAMYPMATRFDWQIDKDMTVFVGATHRDNLDRYYALIRQMLLEPGFRQDDFNRLKTDAINELKVSLREGNDEELGKEELYNLLYTGHPYGHHNLGTLTALDKITLDDVRQFYQKHYTAGRLMLGLAGGYPDQFPARVQADFSALPHSPVPKRRLPNPPSPDRLRFEIIQRETRSTAISLGFPIRLRRGDPDWPALALAASYLGQHRSSVGLLYQRLREARGLNYGDYAYIEYFPRGMYLLQPEPNLGRQQQIFQLWIRPVEPDKALFALRAALFEYDKLIRDGIPQEAFEATREFLGKYVNVLTQTQDARLGYALDSRYYGTAEFGEYLKTSLAKLTPEQVNRALRRHLKPGRFQVVMVTQDANGLKDAILSGKPSPMKYNAPKPSEIMEEDNIISAYPLPVKPDDVIVKSVDRIFN